MKRFVSAGALLLACKAGPSTPTVPKTPPPMAVSLRNVPTVVSATRVAPLGDNTPSAADPILAVMETEVARSMEALRKAPEPAYYLSYQILEQRLVSIEAEGGALIETSDDVARNLDIDIRVGAPSLDNTREILDARGANERLTRRGFVPFSSEPLAVRRALWVETDRRYREAVSALAYVRQDQSTLAQRAQQVPDFAPGKPLRYVQPRADLQFDQQAWVERLKACSANAVAGHATRGSCSVTFTVTTSWFANSEGAAVQQSNTTAQVAVSAGVKAPDGEGLSRVEQRFAATPDGLPSDAELAALAKVVTDDLSALHDAPLGEPYVGPAILEGRAAGVFFHEVFGHRIEGHRQKDETSGQTFATQVGKQIAPAWLSVADDPLLSTIGGVQLNGTYQVDDEGIAAERVPLIERGRLVGFLLGRNPIAGFLQSNGHGRKQAGLAAVARQGNLLVTAEKTVPRAQLERMLLDEVVKQGRPYGMIFTDISGGFTNTSAFAPQAFKVNPVLAYRLYPDGRRELVRGVDMVGTPLVALQSIRAASEEVETFNGVCGAESGWVPVSASAPSLLVEKLEIEKGYVPRDRPPLLDAPAIQKGGAR